MEASFSCTKMLPILIYFVLRGQDLLQTLGRVWGDRRFTVGGRRSEGPCESLEATFSLV